MVKIHHSLCDGLGNLALVAQLLETGPDGVDETGPEPAATPQEVPPGPVELLARSAVNVVRRTAGVVGIAADLAASADRPARVVSSTTDDVAAPLVTLILPHQGALTARRSTALWELPLDRVKAVARAADAHVNDVVLAVVTGTLRRWLIASDSVPDRAAVAAVPVSTRTVEQLFEPGNHVSAYFAHLPVHLSPPASASRCQRSARRVARPCTRPSVLRPWST